ncbi:class I SAM-dependent methyltransferase [Muricauda oceani]|uniref:SAM-dependent methyltransferase n=1 Tax=Flagellimonas oceani TaxID=2698672 RepID=A0A6G7J1L2_9FLAO|nr:methyltransferase domain-containing protein [Allomuricauda oceani]MBW8241345.1 class I SAM-dependent methyltransferase [Allomuricauda oceani]QII44656.1 SAM-dependent methyltransferase [Allomuricauda oceani]
MNQSIIIEKPKQYQDLLEKSKEMGFTMPSDIYIGTLLKTLVASKPSGKFLELGTGIGLSLSWLIQGMDEESKIKSVDNDAALIEVAKLFFEDEDRLELVCDDGGKWLEEYNGDTFDLIFADAWPGKYSHLDKTLGLLKKGGYYVIDDMKKQPNWPEGHEQKANQLIKSIEKRKDITITKMDWSTGLIVAVKK